MQQTAHHFQIVTVGLHRAGILFNVASRMEQTEIRITRRAPGPLSMSLASTSMLLASTRMSLLREYDAGHGPRPANRQHPITRTRLPRAMCSSSPNLASTSASPASRIAPSPTPTRRSYWGGGGRPPPSHRNNDPAARAKIRGLAGVRHPVGRRRLHRGGNRLCGEGSCPRSQAAHAAHARNTTSHVVRMHTAPSWQAGTDVSRCIMKYEGLLTDRGCLWLLPLRPLRMRSSRQTLFYCKRHTHSVFNRVGSIPGRSLGIPSNVESSIDSTL